MPATLGADYVTQGVRTTKHPSIEFRQMPAGRMAYGRGVRLPVWLAVETVEDCRGDDLGSCHKCAARQKYLLPGRGIRCAVVPLCQKGCYPIASQRRR